MSDNNSYMVFSGTATRYLAEKICQSLPYRMKKASADAMFSWYRAHSPTLTI